MATSLDSIRTAAHALVGKIHEETMRKPLCVSITLDGDAYFRAWAEASADPSLDVDSDRIRTNCGNAELVIVRGGRS